MIFYEVEEVVLEFQQISNQVLAGTGAYDIFVPIVIMSYDFNCNYSQKPIFSRT